MPAWRINNISSTPYLNLFDVIGQDGQGHFILHAGLAANSGAQQARNIPVIDMGPPLPSNRPMPANVVGTTYLTVDEQQKIKTFVDRHKSEHLALQKVQLNRTTIGQAYCVMPHATPLKEADGRYTRMRFSCAGFVLEAYKFAHIQIVNENYIPAIDLVKIQQAYPAFSKRLNNNAIRVSLGLSGNGPWPVMLCGYLFHALNRSPQQIRQTSYVAHSGHEVF